MIVCRLTGVLFVSLTFVLSSGDLRGIEEWKSFEFSSQGSLEGEIKTEDLVPSATQKASSRKKVKEMIPPSGLFVHLVRKGDTLEGISRMYCVDLVEMKKLNAIPRDGNVRPGFQLMIPEG